MRAGRAGVRLSLSAVFLDRDGVINVKAPEGKYVTSWAEFAFAPGALEGLASLATLGVPLAVVTNQRGIARGRLSESELANIHRRMGSEVARAGGRLDAIFHCPHEDSARTPAPVPHARTAACRACDRDSRDAAVVGDRASDMEAARSLDALAELVGDRDEATPLVDHAAPDLAAAASWLLSQGSLSSSRSRDS